MTEEPLKTKTVSADAGQLKAVILHKHEADPGSVMRHTGGRR